MTFQEILNFSFFSYKSLTISLFDVLMIGLVVGVTIIIIIILRSVFRRLGRSDRIDKGSSRSVFLILKYLLWVFAISIMLEIAGVNVTLLIAGSAALLVGLGFGIQQIFNDIVSGIILLFEQNVKLNDVVEIESVVGKVKQLNLRTSKIETRDDVIITVPNSKLVGNNVINWSDIEKKTRFNVRIGVAYGSDTQLVSEILVECAKQHKDVEINPEPFVRFENFAESSLDFQLFFWTYSTFRVENIKSEIRYVIDRKFRDNKIRIPFPQRDIHIIQTGSEK